MSRRSIHKYKCPSGKSVFQERSLAEEFCEDKKLRAYKCEHCNLYHVTSEVYEEKRVSLTYYKKFKKFLQKEPK